ncbi:MAG: cytochrome c [Phycisphaerae bacterium]
MQQGSISTSPIRNPQSAIRNSAGRGFLQAYAFVLFLGAVFIYLSYEVTEIQGKGMKSAPAGVNAERGEIIFWDQVKGVCHRCHMIGGRGTMTRCPNLGESELGPPILERAALRAAERTKQTGTTYTAVDYIVESLATPSAYVVEKFPDKLMPVVYTGQTDLSAEEVMSVIAYLQSLTDEVDIEEITKSMSRFGQAIFDKDRLGLEEPVRVVNFPSPEWVVLPVDKLEKYRELSPAEREKFIDQELTEEETEELQDEISDWIEDGREAFEVMKCWQCHMIAGEDFGPLEQGKIGPELTGMGDIQTYEYIRESILNPNAVIVPPLEDHTDEEGRSKMPVYEDSMKLRELDRMIYYLASLHTSVSVKAGAGATEEPTE